MGVLLGSQRGPKVSHFWSFLDIFWSGVICSVHEFIWEVILRHWGGLFEALGGLFEALGALFEPNWALREVPRVHDGAMLEDFGDPCDGIWKVWRIF